MCVAVLLHRLLLRWCRKPTRNVAVQTEATEMRSVRTQAQATYKRYLKEPRFHALGDRDTGAWID